MINAVGSMCDTLCMHILMNVHQCVWCVAQVAAAVRPSRSSRFPVRACFVRVFCCGDREESSTRRQTDETLTPGSASHSHRRHWEADIHPVCLESLTTQRAEGEDALTAESLQYRL